MPGACNYYEGPCVAAQRHKLKTLNLMGCRMHLASFMQMLEMPNCNLKMLIVSCNNLHDVPTCITLLTAALVTSNLKVLDPGGCRSVTSFGWQLFSACLHGNSCVLEVLDLRCNSIDDESLVAIGHAIHVAILI